MLFFNNNDTMVFLPFVFQFTFCSNYQTITAREKIPTQPGLAPCQM